MGVGAVLVHSLGCEKGDLLCGILGVAVRVKGAREGSVPLWFQVISMGD